MDYNNIILAGKNTENGFIFVKLNKKNCNFEYINTTNKYVTMEGLIRDILRLDIQELSKVLNFLLKNGINELLADTDFGIDILSKIYPNFIVYKTVKGGNSFELFEKTDKELVFKEYFDRERINVLIEAESIKDYSTFKKNIEDNDLWGDVENYEEYSNEIELAEEPEPTENLENLKQDFLKEFEKLLQKYYNLDLTKFE